MIHYSYVLTRFQVKGPSGSDWTEKHLNWLHILHEFDYDLKDIFSRDSQLSQSSKIAIYLRAKLKEEWTWICSHDHEESSSIYSCLKDLVRIREEDDAYNTHSNTQSSTKHLTPRSAKSNSTTPQQYPGGTQESRGDFQSTPTPLPRKNKEAAYARTHTPQLLSRKRQLEEIVSPQQGRSGSKSTLRHTETTPPPYQDRDGSPTPRQPSHRPKAPATPSRLVPPPDSPLTRQKQNLVTSARETEGHLEHERFKPSLIEQPLFARQQHLRTPSREEKNQETHGSQKTPPQIHFKNQNVDASSTIRSQHPELQSVTYDDEEDSNEEKDGEEDSDEDDSDSEEAAGGISEAAANDKSEDDVKATGRIFLYLVRDAISNTRKGIEPKKLAEQDLLFETRSESRTTSRNVVVADK